MFILIYFGSGSGRILCLSLFTLELCGVQFFSFSFISLYTESGRILQFIYLSLHCVRQNSVACLSVFTLGQAEFCSLFICLYTGSGRIL